MDARGLAMLARRDAASKRTSEGPTTTYTAEQLAAMSLPDRHSKKPIDLEEVWHHGWLEGMLMQPSDERVGSVGADGVPRPDEGLYRKGEPCRGQRPDEDDPATKGCLLELVRRAWDDPTITPVVVTDERWCICMTGDITAYFTELTEFGVLKAALDAAPVKS